MSDHPDLLPTQAPPQAAAAALQFVTFAVADELFAVPMGPVQEIIRVPEVAHLPLAPPSLLGLANLRGRVLPIVSLRQLLNCPPRAADDATRAVVVHLGQPLGFVVDRVVNVINVEPGEIEPATRIERVVNADYLTGVIQRRRPDGHTDLMMTVDFGKLIAKHFDGLARARSSTLSATTAGEPPMAALGNNRETDGQAPQDATAEAHRLVSFSVCEQEYAIDIGSVQEIVQVPERITALPNAADHVLGMIALRQRLLPLISLRTLFGLPSIAHNEHHRIVVIKLPQGQQVGLVTDAVKEVLSVPREQTEAMPSALTQDLTLQEFSAMCRLDGGKRLVSVIATDRLLNLSGVQDALACAHRQARQPNAPEVPMNTSAPRDDGCTDDDMQVVIFRLGKEEFGVPIMSVQEIVRLPEVLTKVPKTPAFVEGVINLRGTVLPVIDQRARLGMPAIERNDRQRIMVYTLKGQRTGFIVDSVAEVLRIPRVQVTAAPEMSDAQSQLIGEVAKLDGDRRLVLLLDPAHLLHPQELRDVTQATLPSAAASAHAKVAQAA